MAQDLPIFDQNWPNLLKEVPERKQTEVGASNMLILIKNGFPWANFQVRADACAP